MDKTYRTFLRSARNWEEFSCAEKIEQETGLSYKKALKACQQYNKRRTFDEVERGTKLEFEEE